VFQIRVEIPNMGVPTPSKQLSPFSLIVWVWWVMLLVVCVELMLLEKSRGVKGEQIPGYFAIMKTLLSETRGVSHCGLTIYIKKSILRQKKNYGNSNISPSKYIIFKKSSKRNQNPSRYYNSLTNPKFQYKPKYHLSKILI
jgi:hypothetical protein